MKQFLMAVIAWIKVHVWQSVVIGVAAVGVIATSITLPIVLSKEETPQQEPTETNPNPDPTPGPPPTVKQYTINVSVTNEQWGSVEIKVGGETKQSGVIVNEHQNVTLLFTFEPEAYLDDLFINNNRAEFEQDISSYVIDPNDSIATDNVINVNVQFYLPPPPPPSMS